MIADLHLGITKSYEALYRRPFFLRTIAGKVGTVKSRAGHPGFGQHFSGQVGAKSANGFETDLVKSQFILLRQNRHVLSLISSCSIWNELSNHAS
ncbi:hypothetical protein D3C85_1611570 [compost metagenome]